MFEHCTADARKLMYSAKAIAAERCAGTVDLTHLAAACHEIGHPCARPAQITTGTWPWFMETPPLDDQVKQLLRALVCKHDRITGHLLARATARLIQHQQAVA